MLTENTTKSSQTSNQQGYTNYNDRKGDDRCIDIRDYDCSSYCSEQEGLEDIQHYVQLLLRFILSPETVQNVSKSQGTSKQTFVIVGDFYNGHEDSQAYQDRKQL